MDVGQGGSGGGSVRSLVVGVEAGSAAPGRDSEGLSLASSAFDVLRVALYEGALEGPGSVLRPVVVVAPAAFEQFPLSGT